MGEIYRDGIRYTGAGDYREQDNLPSINGNILIGDKNAVNLGIINDTTPSNKTTYSGNKVEEIASNLADNTAISYTTTGINPSITDSADGLIQDLTVYGKSRTSKNLLIPNLSSTTSSGITMTPNGDGTYVINGTATETVQIQNAVSGLTTLTPGNYVASGCPSGGSITTFALRIMNEGGQTWHDDFGDSNAFVVSQTTRVYADLIIRAGFTANQLVFKPMICTAADYAADPTFEPYFSGIHGIGEDGELNVQTCGKNLFDVQNLNVFEGYIDVGAYKYIYSDMYRSIYISVLPSTTYTISKIAGKTFRVATSVEAPADEIHVTSTIANHQGTNLTITTGENDKYLVALVWSSANGDTMTFEEIAQTVQIELGSTATAYEPYISTSATVTTGIPLYAVGDVKDELDEKRGVVVKRCGKVTYAGGEDEEWVADSSSTAGTSGDMQFYIELDHYYAPTPVTRMPRAISNYEVTTAYNIYYAIKTDCVAFSAAGQHLCIRITGISTVADLKTYLASNPVTVVYELSEPYEIPLTSAELSALRNLRTYNPTTNVTVTDNPTSTVGYLLNTDNGQAVADVQNELQEQIDDSVTFDYYVKNQGKINSILNHTYQGEALTDLFTNEIQADYDNAWQWITARTAADNFDGINVADFIPMTIKTYSLNAQIAGIKTYTGYGDTAVGKHIDWISKELYPENHVVNKVNFNNGTAAQNHPWLASDLYHWLNSLAGTVPSAAEVGGGEGTAVDYTEGGVYYYLPTQLKNVIIEKRFLLPTRYSASGLLTDDNSWAWKNIGKLWLPDECEVYGVPVWGGKGGFSIGDSGLQYPLFAGNMNRLKFRNGGRHDWWLLSPYSGNSTHWCYVSSDGHCGYYGAPYSNVAAPVCFRTGETYTA